MQLTIIKIGGKLIEDKHQLQKALQDFAQLKGAKLLVHGGGKRASELLTQMGIEPQMIEGRRVTDEATLEVVTMVYAGLINKNIVAQLQAFNCQAMGLCGADLNSIQAHKRVTQEVDYGFAGDVDYVNAPAIRQLLLEGISPIFSAITHDRKGQLLNTNADTIAAQLAIALAPFFDVQLKFCFEMKGVLLDANNLNSVIPALNQQSYEAYKADGTISAGMIPKIDNALRAQRAGIQQVRICSNEGIVVNSGTQLVNN